MIQSESKLDADDLVLFSRVVEMGSFSRVAERFGIPKATISRRVAALEARLGERLLLRTTRRQSLTEFGQLLLEHAQQVVAELEAVDGLRERRRAAPSGRLRVSMPADFANLVMHETLGAFVDLYPQIRLELDLSPRRVDLMGEGFDLAVRTGSLPDDNLLSARLLSQFTSGLYASSAYLSRWGRPARPEDLPEHKGVQLLGRNGESVAWQLTRGDEQWQGHPIGRVVANSPEFLVRLACAGAGLVAVPDYFVSAELQQGRLVRVLPDWCLPPQQAWVVFPGRKLMPAKSRVFIDLLVATLVNGK